MRRFVIGDIHGQFDAFKSVLRKVDFDIHKDQLIVLGDIYDYGSKVCDVIDYIFDIRHKIVIRGNHDEVFHYWLQAGHHGYNWSHGGYGTLKSYESYLGKEMNFADKMLQAADVPLKHRMFLKKMQDYHITQDGLVFCHAGFDPTIPLEAQEPGEFYNNRSLFKEASRRGVEHVYKRVFVGHTITKDHTPFVSDNLINLDTGAKAEGRPLTLMNVDTFEYVQSYLKNYPEKILLKRAW